MNTDLHWQEVSDRLETVRQEARTRQLLSVRRARVNLWDRLLPPLRRLEGWLERHAASERPGRTVAR